MESQQNDNNTEENSKSKEQIKFKDFKKNNGEHKTQFKYEEDTRTKRKGKIRN